MTYLASTLITRSWYLSGIVARGFQEVSGDQSADGLFLLNALLDFKSSDITLIPYFQEYDFNLVQGQEKYFVNSLVAAETMTFNIQSVRYSMEQCQRKDYFGTPRVDNIQSLPFSYHIERVENGSDVYVYYVPDQTYPAKIWGKFALTGVTANTDLNTVYDNFYIEYLRYALTQYMCQYYDYDFSPDKQRKLQEIIDKLHDVSPPDLKMQKRSTLTKRKSLNYAQANIGGGWEP